jgi:hypothetical protein
VNGVPEYIELGERITKMRRGKGIFEQLMNIFVQNETIPSDAVQEDTGNAHS